MLLPLSLIALSVTPLSADTGQLMVVTTSSWEDASGRLCPFEAVGASWRSAGPCINVVVGKKGLGWALAGEAPVPAPRKHEGDGKGPAGIFELAGFLGRSSAPPRGARFPYRQISDDLHCVDDVASRYYNRLVTEREVGRPVKDLWSSSEHMLRDDHLYDWVIVVDYNRHDPRPGAGSCIFLHVWRGAGRGTAGCTAMPDRELVTLMAWLDPSARPKLVQLPRPAYERLEQDWRLPGLEHAAGE